MSAESDRVWCRGLMAGLAEGGVWGVPRSGLVFTKRGAELVLTARMPFSEIEAAADEPGLDLPRSEVEWAAYQAADYGLIELKFGGAGITVRSEI